VTPLAAIAIANTVALLVWVVVARYGLALLVDPSIRTGMAPFDAANAEPHLRADAFELQKRGFTPIGRKWEHFRFAPRVTSGADLALESERCFATIYGRAEKANAQGPAMYLFSAFDDGALVLTWNTPRELYETPDHVEAGLDTFDIDALLAEHRRRVAPFADRVALPLTAEGRVLATHHYYRSRFAIAKMRGHGRRLVTSRLWLLVVLMVAATAAALAP